jgi:NitT/TauT family transport system substrate-binding protein
MRKPRLTAALAVPLFFAAGLPALAASDQTVFAVGYVPGYANEAADLLGEFKSLPNLKRVQVTSGAAALQFVSAGSIQGVTESGSIPMIIAAQQGVDYKIVWVEDNISNVLVVKPGITSVADLKGKRVSAPAGSVMEFQLDALLEKAGLTRSDVEYINLPPPDAAAAFSAGNLDAVLAIQPFADNLSHNGGSPLQTEPSLDLVYFDSDFVKSNHDTVQSFVCGLQRAATTFAVSPEKVWTALSKSSNQPIDSMKIQLPQAGGMLTAKAGLPLLNKNNGEIVHEFVGVSQILKDAGRIPEALTKDDAAKLIDDSFARFAADGKC